MANNTTEEEREFSGWTLVVILIIVLSVCSVVAWLVWPKGAAPAFNDAFSALNTVFSGMAFAALVFTVFLQRRELELQRQELRDSREELKRTATAQEHSEQALNSQVEAMAATAKINAANAMLVHYREIIAEYKRLALQGSASPDYKQRIEIANEQVASLFEVLEDAYGNVTGKQFKTVDTQLLSQPKQIDPGAFLTPS